MSGRHRTQTQRSSTGQSPHVLLLAQQRRQGGEMQVRLLPLCFDSDGKKQEPIKVRQ